MEGIVWATEASGMSAKLVSLMLEMAMGYGAAAWGASGEGSRGQTKL